MFNYLRRRFSSGDLQGEMDEDPQNENAPGFLNFAKEVVGTGQPTGPTNPPLHQSPSTARPTVPPADKQHSTGPATSNYSHPSPNVPSAVASMKSTSSTYVPNSTSASSGFNSAGTNSGSAAWRGPTGSQTVTSITSNESSGMESQSFPQGAPPASVSTAGSGAAVPTNKTTSSPRVFPSAPTSPTRTASSSFSGFTGSISSTIQRGILAATQSKPLFHRDKCKVLLVVDNSQTDWSKYFYGKKIMGEFDIRVEQCEFDQITISASNDQGCSVEIHKEKSGAKSTGAFHPDFVLIRQPCMDGTHDWRSVISALLFGRVPTLNSLPTVYNMMDRPWVMAHLSLLRNKLGKEAFPMIQQTYFPIGKQMTNFPQFPAVVKMGNAHHGVGKLKVENQNELEDVANVVQLSHTFATVEPLIDNKVDLHIQKIGNHHRAFVRRSITGHWKTTQGSAMIEQVATTERMRMWMDEASKLFGGLDICSLEVMQTRNGEFFIYKLTGSDMQLIGDTQEDDRRIMVDLTLQRMQHYCSTASLSKTPSQFSISSINNTSTPHMSEHAASPQTVLVNQRSHEQNIHSVGRPAMPNDVSRQTPTLQQQQQQPGNAASTMPRLPPSSYTQSSPTAGGQAAMVAAKPPNAPPARPAGSPATIKQSLQQSSSKSSGSVEDGDDTMKNLRKTFAGIFGDM